MPNDTQVAKPEEKIIKTVSCLGFADCRPGDPLYQEGFDVAKTLAEHGFVVANGGGPGVMRASSEGAKAGGGHVVGVTFYPQDMDNFEGRDKNNPMDEEIKTQSYLERTLKLLEVGQCYVIFKGGSGTISEFGMAWGLARLYFGRHKPLILYGKFWENIIAAFIANMRMRPEELQVYRVVSSPEEVIAAINLFEEIMKHSHNGHMFHPNEKAFQI